MKYLKYVALSFLSGVLITASDPFFGIELRFKSVPKPVPQDVKEQPWMFTEAFRPYLTDKDNRVSDIFTVNSYYYPTVHFWFLIYTQFDSTSVILHDKSNLSLIYKVLDFSSLKEKGLPKNTLYVLQQKISQERLEDLKLELDLLAKDPLSNTPEAKGIYRMLRQAKVQLPTSNSELRNFFLDLKKNLRSQTGQRNFIRDGIIRSLPYQTFLAKYFRDKKLPTELLAIPFLESSFNPKAQSKVNALGIWQFMPLISSYYVPKKTSYFDYRFNVGVASVAAANLMSENFKIMKSWDLAVTAYNSGTKHLLKTKRKLARDVSLEDIIKHSDSQHFGFASKNFYSEFLALAHTLAYKEELFPGLHESDRADVSTNLRFFLSKCSLKLKKELSAIDLDDVLFHNHHASGESMQVPKGFIITAKRGLSPKYFFEVPYTELLKSKPKDWDKLARNYNCSTR